MSERKLNRYLTEIAAGEIPDSLDLWPSIRRRVESEPVQPAAHFVTRNSLHHASEAVAGFFLRQVLIAPVPHSRLGWVLLFVVVFLFVGSATYGMSSVISQLFRLEEGLRQVDLSGLYHEVNQSQTVNSVTVTLERAYADANRIVIAYLIESDNAQQHDIGGLSLMDGQGHEFPFMRGMGVGGASELIDGELPPGVRANVLSFDASAVEGAPSQLELHLIMHLYSYQNPMITGATDPVTDGATESPGSTVTELQPVERVEAPGYYRFNFTVPFIPGEIMEVEQTVVRETAEVVCPLEGCLAEIEQVHNVAVRLDQVVLTPSETRATLCIEKPARWSEELTFVASLQPGSGPEVSGSGESAMAGKPCADVRFQAAPANRPTTWTLTLREIIEWTYNPEWNENVDQRRVQGPWRFTFRVP
ncbi:MAG: DUF4179 domain-containing protein [Ardenticatenaceae bacterium]